MMPATPNRQQSSLLLALDQAQELLRVVRVAGEDALDVAVPGVLGQNFAKHGATVGSHGQIPALVKLPFAHPGQIQASPDPQRFVRLSPLCLVARYTHKNKSSLHVSHLMLILPENQSCDLALRSTCRKKIATGRTVAFSNVRRETRRVSTDPALHRGA